MIVCADNPSEFCCAKPTSLYWGEAFKLDEMLLRRPPFYWEAAWVCANLRGIAKTAQTKRFPLSNLPESADDIPILYIQYAICPLHSTTH